MERDESLKKQVAYYNARSSTYSQERYPYKATNFQQYIFKARLLILLHFLEGIIDKLPDNPSILEIGCADGILFRHIEERFPSVFSKLVGVDVAPKMIEEANKQNTNPRVTFLLRDNLLPERFDIVIELGVYAFDIGQELSCVSGYLKEGGYFFYDVSGLRSLYTRFKNKNAPYVKEHKTYKEYETLFSKTFTIKRSRVYALFLPKLWAFPRIARKVQPVLDFLCRYISPELYHEKIYLLNKQIDPSRNNIHVPKVL